MIFPLYSGRRMCYTIRRSYAADTRSADSPTDP
jgi:hypothetical protein